MNQMGLFRTTGPEIWDQTRGGVDFFVAGAGTGGTIAGVGKFLKSRKSEVQLVLADPPGSGLFNKVKPVLFYQAFLYNSFTSTLVNL
jgi:cysteine synthase A